MEIVESRALCFVEKRSIRKSFDPLPRAIFSDFNRLHSKNMKNLQFFYLVNMTFLQRHRSRRFIVFHREITYETIVCHVTSLYLLPFPIFLSLYVKENTMRQVPRSTRSRRNYPFE